MNKHTSVFLVLMLFAAAVLFANDADFPVAAGMTLTGLSGLVVVPDAQIGHGGGSLGLNLGYSLILAGGPVFDHLPRFLLTISKKFELAGLLHIGEDGLKNGVVSTKFQVLEKEGTMLALGGDIELPNSDMAQGENAKIYLSATFRSRVFNLPAASTMTFGWNLLYKGDFSSQLIYGMGLSIGLLPKARHNFLLWVTDYSNFSYSVHGALVDAADKGALNTGLRFNPTKDGDFNLIIDIMATDLLDTSRGVSFSIWGGFLLGKEADKSDANAEKLESLRYE